MECKPDGLFGNAKGDIDLPAGFATRDEANALVATAYRYGPIEDRHPGKHSELLEDGDGVTDGLDFVC